MRLEARRRVQPPRQECSRPTVESCEGTDAKAFENKIVRFLDNYNKEQTPRDYIRLGIERYGDIYLHSNFDNNGNVSGGRIQYVQLFSIVAIFILLIACINFTTLAIGRSAGRSREVGVRKVIGGARKTLIAQFLMEALLLTFLSAMIGLALAKILLPFFN